MHIIPSQITDPLGRISYQFQGDGKFLGEANFYRDSIPISYLYPELNDISEYWRTFFRLDFANRNQHLGRILWAAAVNTIYSHVGDGGFLTFFTSDVAITSSDRGVKYSRWTSKNLIPMQEILKVQLGYTIENLGANGTHFLWRASGQVTGVRPFDINCDAFISTNF